MLRDILPARARKIAYATYAALGLLLGSVPVYCGAVGTETPTVAVGLLAVYSFVGAPLFGATAVANVPQRRTVGLHLEQE